MVSLVRSRSSRIGSARSGVKRSAAQRGRAHAQDSRTHLPASQIAAALPQPSRFMKSQQDPLHARFRHVEQPRKHAHADRLVLRHGFEDLQAFQQALRSCNGGTIQFGIPIPENEERNGSRHKKRDFLQAKMTSAPSQRCVGRSCAYKHTPS